jgi:hypothetical protein
LNARVDEYNAQGGDSFSAHFAGREWNQRRSDINSEISSPITSVQAIAARRRGHAELYRENPNAGANRKRAAFTHLRSKVGRRADRRSTRRGTTSVVTGGSFNSSATDMPNAGIRQCTSENEYGGVQDQ